MLLHSTNGLKNLGLSTQNVFSCVSCKAKTIFMSKQYVIKCKGFSVVNAIIGPLLTLSFFCMLTLPKNV